MSQITELVNWILALSALYAPVHESTKVFDWIQCRAVIRFSIVIDFPFLFLTSFLKPQIPRVLKHPPSTPSNNSSAMAFCGKCWGSTHGGWSNRYRCYRKLAVVQDGLNGRLSSSFSFFSFWLLKTYVPQIKYQTMWHALGNLLNTTLFQKYMDP